MPSVIVIARDVPCIAILDVPARMGERIPNGFAATVFFHCAFDLVALGRCAPNKVGGKYAITFGGVATLQRLLPKWK